MGYDEFNVNFMYPGMFPGIRHLKVGMRIRGFKCQSVDEEG